ncbi:hypothetical protein KC19_12G111500 [Ceratodon purpureus]|uniref:Calponin-homology (CH) domain-containing protein n=1 Tax=Ceratodon purpureus TaxID=3225 RepID=A0A8T0G5Z4_CERPU|nr:hypothetical protein KC19_12G111500 [Ceratodon purpureus]
MHDSTASSFIGSEDGSPSCSSSDEFDYRMPSVISSQCAGNSTLYFTDGLYPNNEMLAGPPYGCGSKEYIIDLMFLESGSGGVGAKLSEARMAARRAEEAGQRVDAIRNAKYTMNSDNLQDSSSRRQQAAQWLQTMVGNSSLPANPTVEDLRVYLKNGYVLCKVINEVQPGSVPKVEDPSNPSQLDGALPNYLYYDNVRNFLVAVEDMGLPAFEASALEQGPMSSNSSAKVIDCILALKSYHDWKQGGALGFWRLKSPTGSGSCVTSSRYSNHSKNLNICSNNSRRKWMLADQESLDGTSLSSSPDQSASFLSLHKDNRASYDDIMRLDQSGQDGVDRKSDERSSSPETSASTSTWLQDIRHKFSEVLQIKAKRAQDTLTATPIVTDGYGGGATMMYDQNAPSQSLLSLISAIIGDKPAEEVPVLVEFMLRKIMEEFERHLLNQRNQVTKAINPSLSIAKMKTALKDIMVREEKLASQNMVLEALAAGTQEETKVISLASSLFTHERIAF